MWLRRSRAPELALAVLGAALAGCGGSSSAPSLTNAAPRVCRADQVAARAFLRMPVSVAIANSDPRNIRCLLSAGSVRVVVMAEASGQAYTQYDTMVTHQQQVFGPARHEASQIPQTIQLGGAYASWVPGRQELLATNGGLYRGGSYVTVTVERGAAGERLRLARVVAARTLRQAPRGPAPGAPPS